MANKSIQPHWYDEPNIVEGELIPDVPDIQGIPIGARMSHKPQAFELPHLEQSSWLDKFSIEGWMWLVGFGILLVVLVVFCNGWATLLFYLK